MTNIATDSPFTAVEQSTLQVFAGAVIPASAEYGIPGADDADIVADILATARPYYDAVRAGLAFQDTVAEAAYGVPFADLSEADRADFVERSNTEGGFDHIEWEFDPQALSGQRTLISIILQCYYRDDRVMRSLEMEPRPPFPQGFEVEQGDWSLLDPVKQRGKIYRPV